MSTDNNIFNENNQQGETPQDKSGSGTPESVQNKDSFADLLGAIVNERGERKYGSVEDALKGTVHAQDFIKQLKEDNERLRNELSKAKDLEERYNNIEETVKKLTSQRADSENTPPKAASQDDISAIVANILASKESEAVSSKNINEVVNAMRNKFGETAEKEFYDKAADIGMSREGIEQLARTSPKAVYKLFGFDAAPSNSGSTKPNVSSFNTTGNEPRTETSIQRSSRKILMGGTTSDLLAEVAEARKAVEELQAQGLSSYDLSDPKTYRKFMQRNK